MFEMLTDGRTYDGRTTDARVTGILIAHLGAFGSGELKMFLKNKLIWAMQKCMVTMATLLCNSYR